MEWVQSSASVLACKPALMLRPGELVPNRLWSSQSAAWQRLVKRQLLRNELLVLGGTAAEEGHLHAGSCSAIC